MGLFRKIPVVVNAWKIDSPKDFEDEHFDHILMHVDDVYTVKTMEGHSYRIEYGTHHLVKGVDGEYYPCENKIFAKTYEAVHDATS
jgi:hypothetical protein